MKLNSTPQVFLFWSLRMIFVASSQLQENAQVTETEIRKTRSLIPPLFPPGRSKRSAEALTDSEFMEKIKTRNIRDVDSEFIPPIFPPSLARLRAIRSADSNIIPPLFPPSRKTRETRSTEANLIPPIFPPSRRWKRESMMIPPLFPPTRRGKRSAESQLIPPLFPPRNPRLVSRMIRSADGNIIPPLFPPGGATWLHSRRRRSLIPPLFPPSHRNRRSTDDSLIPPIFPPSSRLVRSLFNRKSQQEKDRNLQEQRPESSSTLLAVLIGSLVVGLIVFVAIAMAIVKVLLQRTETISSHNSNNHIKDILL